MTETIRCPECGARNRSGAEWCARCLVRFALPDMQDSVSARQEEHESSVDVEQARPGPNDTRTPRRRASPGRRGAFKVTDEGITWTCGACESENPLELTVCSVCGTSFAQTVNPPPERPERDPGTAALLSLFLPGAGHAYLGLWGQAVARGMVSLWVVSVALVAAVQGRGGSAWAIAGTFGVVAVALWTVAAHDAFREANREENLVILKGRVFLYLVLGLLLLLSIMLVATFLRAQAAA